MPKRKRAPKKTNKAVGEELVAEIDAALAALGRLATHTPLAAGEWNKATQEGTRVGLYMRRTFPARTVSAYFVRFYTGRGTPAHVRFDGNVTDEALGRAMLWAATDAFTVAYDSLALPADVADGELVLAAVPEAADMKSVSCAYVKGGLLRGAKWKLFPVSCATNSKHNIMPELASAHELSGGATTDAAKLAAAARHALLLSVSRKEAAFHPDCAYQGKRARYAS